MEISIVLNIIVIVLLVVLVIVEWFAYRSDKSDLKAVWQGNQFEQKYVFEHLLFLKSSLRVLLSVMVIVARS
jgi:sterol desaturase/sphingolipid hydroxylase (fatty acid hydroxylase superfamily)